MYLSLLYLETFSVHFLDLHCKNLEVKICLLINFMNCGGGSL